ncbi:hypothetical protein IKE67_05590 [bacterium]|nr:hypothetical protein [bacterium]
MDIKATQLKNTRIDETMTSNIRMSPKVAENGKTFIDEMFDMPKLPAENASKNVAENKSSAKSADSNSKNLEFISQPQSSFAKTIKNEKLTIQERQALHKAAEKELVDEIVLMNNKQNVEVKNSVKNDLNKAQVSVAKKSDNQIEEENKEVNSEIKDFDKFSSKPEINNTNFVNSKELELAEAIENELILPEQNKIEEIIGKPENLEKFEDLKLEEIEQPEIVQIKEFESEEIKPQAIEKFEQPEIAQVKEFKNEEIKPQAIEKFEQPEIAQVKEFKNEEIKPQAIEKFEQPEIAQVKELKNEEIKLQAIEKFEQPEIAQVKEFKNEENKPQAIEKSEQTKVAQVKEFKNDEIKPQKFEKIEQPKVAEAKSEQIIEDEVIQEFKNFEKPEKVEFVENLINNSKINEKFDKKSDKAVISKISDAIKPEAVKEPEKVGKIKDIAEEVNIKPVEMKPLPAENIKVIKMEVVNPLTDLNNSLNTTKTSDIVKFIDANLSTESAKTSKSSTAKKAENAKKAASEKAIKMTEADAKFFNNLIETNQQVIEGTKSAEQINNNVLKDVETAQSAQVSKTLLNALKESQETNKPFHIDFDKDVSVILRVGKNGQISADFIPGDEAVEQYLKANIPLLKQKFADEGIEYDSLSYRQNKKESNEEREKHNRGNKKENGYE